MVDIRRQENITFTTPEQEVRELIGEPEIDEFLYMAVPEQFAAFLALEYGQTDREQLAKAAVEAELNEMADAYGRHNPFVRQIALGAARRALGLKDWPIPAHSPPEIVETSPATHQEQEGEQ